MGQFSHSTQTRHRVSEPRKYKVIMHNDDFTTMEFVVEMLRIVFFKSTEEATTLMLKVHHEDRATVGIYSYDVAKSRVQRAMEMAKEYGFPFLLTMEPEEPDLPF